MFSQLRKRLEDSLDAVEQLATPLPLPVPRPASPSPRSTTSSLQARLGNAVKAPPLPAPRVHASLEERLKAKFSVGDASAGSSRPASPMPPVDPAQIALPPSPVTETTEPPLDKDISTSPRKEESTEEQATTIESPHEGVGTPISDADVYADPELLRERLGELRQRMQGFEAVLLQYPSLSSPDALRLYLQNAQSFQTENARLKTQIQVHDSRLAELRDTHRLESASQSSQIATLTSQLSSLPSQSLVQTLQTKAADEEEKRVRAISLLKTVRTKLVAVEKQRDDLVRERDDMRLERDAARGETAGVRNDVERLRAEREREVGNLQGRYEREMGMQRERWEREAKERKSAFELDVIHIKAAHSKELAGKSQKIQSLETQIQSLTQDKDTLFTKLQLKQSELESTLQKLESLEFKNSELAYTIREQEDVTSSSLLLRPPPPSHNDSGGGGGSTAPPSPTREAARLLSEAEARYDSRVSDLKAKVMSLEKERTDAEEEWARLMAERGREVERLRRVNHEKEGEWGRRLEGVRALEVRLAEVEGAVKKREVEVEEGRAREVVLEREVARLRDLEGVLKEEKHDAMSRLAHLERTIEELKTKELAARSSAKTLREELRKVQSSAALLERQRNPGVGYWSAANSSTEGSSTPRSPAPPSEVSLPTGNEEEVNLEYLRNVILQFLENDRMRPDLVRVLSIILRFTPQETRRLVAKVS